LRIALLIITSLSVLSANGQTKINNSNEYKMPPISQREIIGTWLKSKECSRSFEKVINKVFQVVRCDDGTGGNEGSLIFQVSANKFRKLESRNKDYYVILPDGNLSVRDNQGEIDIERKFDGNWAKSSYSRNPPSVIEDHKTIGLKCYDIGYRFGFVGTKSFKGVKTNPDWDFAVPDRCKNTSEVNSGIQAGTKAAW